MEGTVVCFVCPLMEGGDLESALSRLPPLSPSARLQLAADCAEGLAVLHEQHICHRDFKPANVLLRADGRAVRTAPAPYRHQHKRLHRSRCA